MVAGGQITSSQLNDWMLRLSKQVGEAITQLEAAGDEAPEARFAYEKKWAQIYESLPPEDSVASREAAANNATVSERRDYERARNRLKRAEKVLGARMAQLSALQSVGASVREEARFERTGPGVTT